MKILTAAIAALSLMVLACNSHVMPITVRRSRLTHPPAGPLAKVEKRPIFDRMIAAS